VRTHAELKQNACTCELTLYRPCVCITSKTKIKIGSPGQEEAFGIDNQGPLKAWMLFLTEKTMQGITKQKKKSEIGL
jgi:hypothetical protein